MKYCFLMRVDFIVAAMATLVMENPSKIVGSIVGFTGFSEASLRSREDSASFSKVFGLEPSTSEVITRASKGSEFSSIPELLSASMITPKRFTVISRAKGHFQ